LAAERVRDLLVDELFSRDLFLYLDRVVLEGELLGRLLRDDPRLAVHECLHVGDLRVGPEVGDAMDGLGAEGRGRDQGVPAPEHDEGEPDHLGLVAFEQVMVADRVVVHGTVAHGVDALDDVPGLVEVLPLPLDELRIGRVDGGEPPPPVDREPAGGHDPLVLAREVADDGQRLDKPVEHVLRDLVQVAVEPDRLLVPPGDPFRDADDGSARDVECHRVEHLPAPHPPEPCDHVGDDVGPAMPHVHCTARVRVGNVQVEFLEVAGIGLERVEPSLVGLFLEFQEIEFTQSDSPSKERGCPYTGLSLMTSLLAWRRIISWAMLEFFARWISPLSLTVAVKRYSLPAKTSTILPLSPGAMIVSCFLSVWILMPPPMLNSSSALGCACWRSNSVRGLMSIPIPSLLTIAETFLPPLPIAAGTSLSSM